MPLDQSAPGLDALLLGTVLEMELSPRDHQVASRRYQLVPEHLQKHDGPLGAYIRDGKIYPQGSRAIGATIVNGADDDRFDLDAILEFSTPPGWKPAQVLDSLHEAFEGFPDVREIERCTRCIQLRFAFMHLDVTPLDPAPEPRNPRQGEIYHSPDTGEDERYAVNPFGFAEWFRSNVSAPNQAFLDHVAKMRASLEIRDRFDLSKILADADIDSLPAPDDPIRYAPQVIALKLMKRYLNLRYSERSVKRPISIYLSKIAAEVPVNSNGIWAQLANFADELDRRMKVAEETGLWPDERNPAFPEEKFNDRWPEDWQSIALFRDDLRHLKNELSKALNSELAEIRKIIGDLCGEGVVEKSIRNYAKNLPSEAARSRFQHGKGFLMSEPLS